MPFVVTANEYLEVDGYPLATPAGRLSSLAPLWAFTYRGDNRLIPSLTGRSAYPRRIDETTRILTGWVFGDSTSEGIAHPDVRTGIDLNLEELFTQVLDPTTAGSDGTRPAVWHRAGGDVEADIQVAGFEIADFGPTTVTYKMTVTVPAGLWTPVAP